MEADELLQLMQSLNIEKVRPNTQGTEISGCCPFHTESNPSFAVNIQKLIFNCFSCHASGNLLLMVGRIIAATSLDQARIYIEKFGDYDPSDLESRVTDLTTLFRQRDFEHSALAQVPYCNYAPYSIPKRCRKAREYLERRGIMYSRTSTLSVTRHLLGYDNKTGRVLFPWIDTDGMFYGCMGRLSRRAREGEVRYTPMFGLQKGSHLFPGIVNWKSKKGFHYVGIFEGEIDAIRIGQLFNKIKTLPFGLGHSRATKHQIRLLKELGGPYLIGTDGDESGQRGAEMLGRDLGGHDVVHYIHWPKNKKDAGSNHDEDIVRLVQRGTSLRL